MDLPSTEKVYHHDIHPSEGSFECRLCGIIAATPDPIKAQPCRRSAKAEGVIPGKLGCEEPPCRLITFTPDWPVKLQEMIGDRLDETWELTTESGRFVRMVVRDGELYTDDEIPSQKDFPLMIAAIPKHQLLREELEKLELEEELLQEQMRLEELNQKASTENLAPEEMSRVNSTIPASSGAAPSSFMCNLDALGIVGSYKHIS